MSVCPSIHYPITVTLLSKGTGKKGRHTGSGGMAARILPPHWIDVSGQLHAPAFLPPWKELPVLIG